MAYAGRKEWVIAQVALSRDEGIGSTRCDRRLDGCQAEAVHESHTHGGQDEQAGEPAACRGERGKRPHVKRNVLAKGGVGLAERYLGLQSQPGLPLAERGQPKGHPDQQRRDGHAGYNRCHAARLAIFLGRHAPQAPGGPGQVDARERAGYGCRRNAQPDLRLKPERKDGSEPLCSKPPGVEPQAQPEWHQQQGQYRQAEDYRDRAHGAQQS